MNDKEKDVTITNTKPEIKIPKNIFVVEFKSGIKNLITMQLKNEKNKGISKSLKNHFQLSFFKNLLKNIGAIKKTYILFITTQAEAAPIP